jgi:hypothetical protein
MENLHVVIWIQLHILRKIQCSIILNLTHNMVITEFAMPILSVLVVLNLLVQPSTYGPEEVRRLEAMLRTSTHMPNIGDLSSRLDGCVLVLKLELQKG